ncbi:MAG: site-specific integrase [Ktedonobacterales bacterium]|nr:site-specific integrase [Ktedonobacterales bacterium]
MKGRRGNSEGTITQRKDGRWEARVSLPNGKRKSYYGKSQKEVQKLLLQARKDVEAGLPIADDRQTVAQYFEHWLEMIRHRVKDTGYMTYKRNLNKHILPELGNIVLSKLTVQQIQRLYNKKIEDGLAPASVHNIHTIIHAGLDYAVRLSLLQRNISDLVQKPRHQRTRFVTLKEDQVQIFLETVRLHRLAALYLLALATGMREGELLGLCWEDVDFPTEIVEVKRSLQFSLGKFKRILGEPKTSNAVRRIALPATVLVALKRHKQLQDEEKRISGELWDGPYDLVFTNTIGRPIHNTWLIRDFHSLLASCGLPQIRFHDLRHTAATLLLRRGVNPKIVSEMLGHANIAITLDVYSHVTPDMQESAAKIMDQIVKRGE